MFYFIHVLAGALIANYFPSLLPIIIISLLFHFILDIIPHKDNLADVKLTGKSYDKIKLTKKAVLFELADMLIGIILIICIFLKFHSILMMAGIFFSLLPDMIKIFYLTPFKNNKLFRKYMLFHSKIQLETRWLIGLIAQLIVIIILLFLLFY